LKAYVPAGRFSLCKPRFLGHFLKDQRVECECQPVNKNRSKHTFEKTDRKVLNFAKTSEIVENKKLLGLLDELRNALGRKFHAIKCRPKFILHRLGVAVEDVKLDSLLGIFVEVVSTGD